MVILIIQVEDFSLGLVDSEPNPPVAGDRKTPGPLSVAAQLVRFPTRNVVEFPGVLHLLQEGENVTNLLEDGRGQAGRIIALDEAPQSSMRHVSDLHQFRLRSNA